MLTVHHLNESRSQRILWLLEELGLPYELKIYQRDAQTRLAPPELKAVSPLGIDCHGNNCTNLGLPTRYFATFFRASQSCSHGEAMYLLIHFATYWRSIRSRAK